MAANLLTTPIAAGETTKPLDKSELEEEYEYGL